ncbi:ureidoglycolate lyase [Ferrovibrio sp.]|uniref:ureidoglycolate lyase n=1 Tax=Ferrovibrio sp. TaxID=1917215 RepID=UPI0035B17C81
MTTLPEKPLPVETVSAAALAPFGWLLGKAVSTADAAADTALAFTSPATDFWHEHGFDTGPGGETDILWVVYRSTDRTITECEKHSLTQQAVIPLTGAIIQILALPAADGAPDMTSARAFVIPVGTGICMRPGIWHTTRVPVESADCLMLSRRSTTADLVRHLNTGTPAQETQISAIPAHVLSFPKPK